jgi:hypothetical protein
MTEEISSKSGRLVRPEAIDEFRSIANAPDVAEHVVEGLRHADEEHELEPALMRITGDVDVTPHGPTEEADIVSVHLRVEGRSVLAALVLKGKAWQSVKARDVSHQILRAAQLPDVGLVVVGAVGDIQDDVKRDLAFLGDRAGLDWLLLDRGDLARLLTAYRQLCPNDGSWLRGQPCPTCGFGRRPVRGRRPAYHALTLEDVSFAAAKRYAAHILVPPGLSEGEVESRTASAVQEIRRSRYTRNAQVEQLHGRRDADVVFAYVYEDITDKPFANWICRALWISPKLDSRWHPSLFGEPTADPSLRLDWNRSYEAIAELLADRQDKATYLNAVDKFVNTGSGIVEEARKILVAEPLTESREARLREITARIDGVPRPDGMKAPPHELAELDNLYAGLDGDLLNLALPFGERGPKTWPEPERRHWLAQFAIDAWDRDLPRFRSVRDGVR